MVYALEVGNLFGKVGSSTFLSVRTFFFANFLVGSVGWECQKKGINHV